MSASREKKKRFEERADGTEKRQVRAKDDYKSRKRKKLIGTIAAVVVVVLLVLAVVVNSNLFYTGVTAVKTGDAKYTTADFNYEYFNAYYGTYEELYNTYGAELVGYLLNPQTPLDEQNYSETQTWDEYFEEYAMNQLQQMAMLNDMAKAEGWSLSAEQKAEIDANIDRVKTDAVSNGYSDYRAYLRNMFGKGITEERLRSLLESSFNATYYSQYLIDKWMNSYTEEELSEYYDGQRNAYDLVSYMAYFVDGSVTEDSELDADTALQQAKDIATEIATAGDQATFAEVVYQNAPEDQKSSYADPDACLNRLKSPTAITNEAWKNWLMDSERQTGDSNIFAGENGYYVLLFLERNGNEYKTANFRGITITVETDPDSGLVTDATRSAAEATVDMILEAFNEDPTEENFAELANTYNSDGAMNGGLCQNYVLGQIASKEIEDYLFSEETPAGEVKSFYYDGSYFVVYTMERGEQYNLLLAKNLKASDQYKSTVEAVKADYPIEKKFAFRFAK